MNYQNKYIAPTPRYAILQGSFWGSFCIIFAYASVYLLSRGYSNSQIGVVVAAAGVISAFLQPIVANFADRSKKISLRTIISFWAALLIAVSAALLIPGLHFLLVGIFYGVAVAGLQILTPLVYAIGMECINRGIPVNFGVARGIGSVTYAITSYLSGKLVAEYDTVVIPMMIIFFYVIVILASVTFKFPVHNEEAETKESEKAKAPKEVEDLKETKVSKEALQKGFFSRYGKFFILLVGVTFSFISHNLLNNYMFQIMEYRGGGSSEMGTALAIAATVELPTMVGFTFLIRKFRSGTLIKVSGTFFAIKAFLTLIAPSVIGLYVAQGAQILGFALQVPASVYYVNSLMEPQDRVKGQAFMTITNTLGSIGGSLVGGVILDTLGVGALLIIGFITAAIGMGITFVSTDRQCK